MSCVVNYRTEPYICMKLQQVDETRRWNKMYIYTLPELSSCVLSSAGLLFRVKCSHHQGSIQGLLLNIIDDEACHPAGLLTACMIIDRKIPLILPRATIIIIN